MFLDNYFFEEKCSSIIKIRGTDKFKFLQGIISNDIEILRENHLFIHQSSHLRVNSTMIFLLVFMKIIYL